ncbi:hypothetical protein T310_3187 [Rasamsonia emersonii CBS 393.64]|uniref:Solid-state culture expressed protein (Aos23) n=1 Tax=Rasamsonia emersonii (strain ATCC 16479 / CBS 393.64 / IMI 116815) TaxID=1408163 RepID=A0A0F4YXG8_RASE3|nr:hypothetical protein T310_3187 [Rasamsonia emersonii CBS 393.64]KKA22775.1 hypothetical protein T310_3187 [Rasamsonia emersonii CBS 393.64]
METVNKVVDAGKRAIWGESNNETNKPHGEEPISGVTGKGTATDPYDAGNRDVQPDAPPVAEGGISSEPVEQRTSNPNDGSSSSNNNSNSKNSKNNNSSDLLKTTASSQQPDPASSSDVGAADTAASQPVGETNEQLKKQGEKQARDPQQDTTKTGGDANANNSPSTKPSNNNSNSKNADDASPSGSPSSNAKDAGNGHSNSNSNSNSNKNSNSNSNSNAKPNSNANGIGHKRNKSSTSRTLEKVKDKLHIGRNSSTKAS